MPLASVTGLFAVAGAIDLSSGNSGRQTFCSHGVGLGYIRLDTIGYHWIGRLWKVGIGIGRLWKVMEGCSHGMGLGGPRGTEQT